MRGRVYSHEAYAALAARGYYGLEHAPSGGVWVPDRRVYSPPIGFRIPPPIARLPERERERIRRCVTTDGTSGKALPQSTTEWTNLGAPGVAAPDAIWLMQEASGNLADSSGNGFTLTKSGTWTYQNSETGWSTKSIRTADAQSNTQMSSTSTNLPDISTTSFLLLGYWSAPAATPAAARNMQQTGTTTVAQTRIQTTPRLRCLSAANSADAGSGSPLNAVHPLLLQVDRTNSVVRGITDQATAIPTFGSTMTGKGMAFGSGGAQTAAQGFLYGAMWKGVNAELSPPNLASLLDYLLWTRLWTTAFVVGLSDSESLAESVGVVYSAVVAQSESESEAESLAVQMAATVAQSESMSEAESVAATMAVTLSQSEALADAESMVASMAAHVSQAESTAIGEAVAASMSIVLAQQESMTVAEIAAVVLTAVIGLSDAASMDESGSASVAFGQPLSEAIAITEQLDAEVAMGIALSEGMSLAEAIVTVALRSGPLFGSLAKTNVAKALISALRVRGTIVKR